MTTSRFPEITDELLSAYIDNAVTPGERALVEQAASEDGVVAWRLATLRETVALLRALPMLNAPRAFVLTPEMVRQSHAEPFVATGVVAQTERTVQHPPHQPAPQPGWWARLVAGWRAFWDGGSPVWRNALATSMAALLVLLVLPTLLSSNTRSDLAATPMVSQVSQESAAAPASEGVVEMSADAARVENATSTAGKLAGAATAIAENDTPQDAEAVALAPALAASVTEAQAPLARSVEGEVVAAPAEGEAAVTPATVTPATVTPAAVTVRTIPGARASEDALSGIASAESAPAYTAAASAPSAPEGTALSGAVLAAAAPAVGVVAADAAPASQPMLATADVTAATTSTESAAPTGIAMPAATAMPTTVAPTTVAPTTVAPTIVAPTTVAPTTVAPTTVAPTTVAPTTVAPTTVAPTTVAVAEARRELSEIATAPLPAAAMPPPTATASRTLAIFLPWLQIAALAGVVTFGFLWWRSRRV